MKGTDVLNMVQEILHKDVRIQFVDRPNKAHYVVTPYSFLPKIGNKVVSTRYVDMGQGLLECLHEIHAELQATARPDHVLSPHEVSR